MNEPIKVGDLVQVVRGMLCCGHSTPMQGHIFKVTGFKEDNTGYICDYCRGPAEHRSARGGESAVDLPRLKRIPPLSELEGQPTQEDMKEPA